MTGHPTRISRRTFLKLSLLNLAGLAWSRLDGMVFIPLNTPQPDEPYPEVIHSLPVKLPYFALTIDDGFDAEALVEILDIMEESRTAATFFMVARAALQAERTYPGIMRRLAENGNELGYHTITHERPAGGWELEWLIGDYTWWMKYHQEMLGDELFAKAVKPYARAPWDNFSRPWLRMCQAENLLPVSWNNDPGSSNRGQKIAPGDIYLLHVRQDDMRYLREFCARTTVKPVPLSRLLRYHALQRAKQRFQPQCNAPGQDSRSAGTLK